MTDFRCKICNFVGKNPASLSKHITQTHKMDIKNYYDLYIKTEINGKCLNCNKETTYQSFRLGYSLTCSHSCGCKLHRKYLVSDPERHRSFVIKVKDNQSKIWYKRNLDGTGIKIRNKISKTIRF